MPFESIKEEDSNGVVKAINTLVLGKDVFLDTMRKNIETVLGEKFDQSIDEIESKLTDFQNELVRLANNKQKYETIVEEIYRLRELKEKILIGNAERQGKRQRIAEMAEFLNSQSGILLEFDDKLVRRIVDKVTVYDGRLTVEFKTGTEVDIKL